MFIIAIGNTITKRYRLQWHSYNGKRYYVRQTRILHAISLDNVKDRALQIFGSLPDNIQRV